MTVIGLQLGGLLASSCSPRPSSPGPAWVWWTYRAILSRDYPIAQGAVLVSATIYVVVNLLVDIPYAYLDLRISVYQQALWPRLL